MNLQAGIERLSAVEGAREGWIRHLIDLSRRNNLLYHRNLKTATLDLTNANEEALKSVLSGKSVSLSQLLPDTDDVKTSAIAREIYRRAQTNLEEKGLETLFLAMGMATWAPSDDGRPPESAILLIPVTLEMRGLGRSIALKRSGDILINLVLLHVLEVEHGCKVSPELLTELIQRSEDDESFDPSIVFDALCNVVQKVKGFAVIRRVVLGNFSFQKMAMVKDLRERGAEMVKHDIISAIAGDSAALDNIRSEQSDIEPAELDRTAPEAEYFILDADSSQQRVASMVLAGQSTVIQGPPGTGKSQTIANMIAALAADGRRVLFVAEKRAALEVVHRRLESVGLGHLALDLHGADLSRQAVMKRIAASLDLVRNALPINPDNVHRRFAECRDRLNQHVKRLHLKREPSGLTFYEMQGRLLRLPSETHSPVRWRDQELNQLDGEAAAVIEDLLAQAVGFPRLFLRTDPSPWTGAILSDGATTLKAMDLVGHIADQWPALLADLTQLVTAARLQEPATLDGMAKLVMLVNAVATMVGTYADQLFEQDLDSLRPALVPASRGAFVAFWAFCFKPDYRQALRVARNLRKAGPQVTAAQLYEEIVLAAEQQRHWREIGLEGSRPVLLLNIRPLHDRLQALFTHLADLAPVVGSSDLNSMDLAEFGRYIQALNNDRTTPHYIAPLLQIEQEIAKLGAEAIIKDLRKSDVAPDCWPERFRYAWLASCLDRARSEDPGLSSFQGRLHDKYAEEFRLLDKKRTGLAAERVRRRHAEHAIEEMNAYPDQEALVRRQAEKKTRHMPLRKLLAQAPDVLTALFPCFMASPLSVSQLMEADNYFDVVLFDEASQVLPEDAVPSILRASQVVVAGDEHQLPPTMFFADGAGEEDEMEECNNATVGFESLLKLTGSFLPKRMLEWHYRSQDEALIAFSNRHIYDQRLVTFPGRGGAPAVLHFFIDQPPGGDGQEESSDREVLRVVELVLEHAATNPQQSLGVITMGIKHAMRVQAELDKALRANPHLESYFDTSHPDRFFVKNLERVQGDERDVIILSVGYGKDRSGKLPYRFGPLLYDGGERRLNVAVTRARKRMILVSSFTHLDMDPGRSRAKGVELLRLYLQYAATQGKVLGDSGSSQITLNEFEADVKDALTAKGIPLLPQWGASVYRIDLVAQHPQKPGRFVLAIECDGATYHSAPTARDRDRLRQQHLEALGWRFHRIWSSDWFMRRNEEIERAVAAFEKAVAFADFEDTKGNETAMFQPLGASAPNNENTPKAAPRSMRAPRPRIPVRESIQEYQLRELVDLIRWIRSDGRLCTDDEIVDEMVRELGFKRRGQRIEEAIREAIERAD